MIKTYIPFILLALGAALIVYMHCTHNNSCCDHAGHHHNHDKSNHAHKHQH